MEDVQPLKSNEGQISGSEMAPKVCCSNEWYYTHQAAKIKDRRFQVQEACGENTPAGSGISQSSPETWKQPDVYRERVIYFKELAHAIVEAGKSRSAGWASRLGTRRRAAVHREVCPLTESPLCPARSGLRVLHEAHVTLQRVNCFTQSLLISMLISCKIYLPRNIQNIHQISGYRAIEELTQKLNHRKGCKWTLGEVLEVNTKAEYCALGPIHSTPWVRVNRNAYP